MNFKKAAIDKVVETLRKNLGEVSSKIAINTRQINRLSDEQRVLKKQKYEICLAIRELLKNSGMKKMTFKQKVAVLTALIVLGVIKLCIWGE